MRGKKARAIRKSVPHAKHVRQALKAIRASNNMDEIKERAKERKRRAEGEKLAAERGKSVPLGIEQIPTKGVKRLK